MSGQPIPCCFTFEVSRIIHWRYKMWGEYEATWAYYIVQNTLLLLRVLCESHSSLVTKINKQNWLELLCFSQIHLYASHLVVFSVYTGLCDIAKWGVDLLPNFTDKGWVEVGWLEVFTVIGLSRTWSISTWNPENKSITRY